MSFSESLTVRILGDSSGLRQELDTVSSEIQRLQQNLSSAANSTDQLQQSFSKLSAGLKPLQQLNAQLSQIQQKIRAISQQPISLNVQPALQALQQLMQYAMLAAQQIQTILGTSGGGRTSPTAPAAGSMMGGGTGAAPPTSPRAFAGGGLVTGPSGIDRVHTRLTAGEFVLSQTAVSTLGLSFLNRLNRQPQQTLIERGSITQPTVSTIAPTQRAPKSLNTPFLQPYTSTNANQTNGRQQLAQQVSNKTANHFGGITINVEQSADLDTLFRDFRSQGIDQRHRRG